MILDRTRRNLPLIVAGALLSLLLFWAQTFYEVPLTSDVPIPKGVFHPLLMWLTPTGVFEAVVSLLATLALALLLYFINNKHSFIRSREHLLVFIWILIFGAFPQLHVYLDAYIAIAFVLLSLNSLFSVYRLEYDFSSVFLTAFYLSLATLFYTLSAYLLLPILIGLLLLKPFKWRDVIVFLSGLFCPYYFAAFYFYFVANDWQQPFDIGLENILSSFSIAQVSINVFSSIFLSYIGFLLVMELFNAIRLRSGGIKQKMLVVNVIFWWILFVGILVSAFFLPQNGELLLFFAIPCSVVLSNFFAFIKRDLWGNIFFVVLVLLSLLSLFGATM